MYFPRPRRGEETVNLTIEPVRSMLTQKRMIVSSIDNITEWMEHAHRLRTGERFRMLVGPCSRMLVVHPQHLIPMPIPRESNGASLSNIGYLLSGWSIHDRVLWHG